jgi:hypothetical protein
MTALHALTVNNFSVIPSRFSAYTQWYMDRYSSVGIATRYGLDSPGIESWWGRDFPQPSRPGPGAHPASYTMGTESYPGVKRPGRGVNHPPPTSAEVKERVRLYLHSPFGSSWPVLGWTLLYCTHSDTDSANNRLPIEEQILQILPNITEIHSIDSYANHGRTRTEHTRHPISCSTCVLRSREVQLVASKIQEAAMKRQQQLRSCLYNLVNQSRDNIRILPANHRTYINIDLVEQSIARIMDSRFVISVACEILSNTLIPTIFRRRTKRVKRKGKIC